MIPLRDSIPSSRPPVLTFVIIGLNLLFFLLEISLGAQLPAFVQEFGFVPRKFLMFFKEGMWGKAILPVFTSMFLHGGWLHLIGNMWILHIFGDNVEDTLGHGRYVFLYLGSGVAGCLAQLYFNPASQIPMVGASGAIAGVMGAYFTLFPNARIFTLIPIFFFVIIEVPAYVFLGLWFVLQFFQGTFTLLGPRAGAGVAFLAHVGGFLAGFFILQLLKKGRKPRPVPFP